MGSKPTYEELEQRVKELESAALEHKGMEADLRRSEDQYLNIYNRVQVGIFQTRLSDGKVLECNDRFARTYGFESREECMADYVLAEHYVDPGTREQMLEKIMDAGEVDDFEARFCRKDGEMIWVRFSARAFPEEGLLEGFAYDITREKEGERALKKSQERLNVVLENINDAVWSYDLDGEGNFVSSFISPAGSRMLGITQEELNHSFDVWFSHVLPEDLPDVKKAMAEAMHIGQGKPVEYRLTTAEGVVKWICSVGKLNHNEDGTFSLIGTGWDITERKQAERVLLEFKTAVEQSVDGIALSDMEGNIRFVNHAWAEMHGYSSDEVIGRHLSVFHTKEQMEKEVIPYNEQLIRSGSKQGEIGHVRKDGTSFPTQMTTTIIRGANKEPFAMLAITRDISENKQAEAALRELKERFEKVFLSQRDAILLLDAQIPPLILDCNPAALQVFGYSREELLGQTTEILYENKAALLDFQEQLYPSIERLGYFHIPNLTMKRKDGSLFPSETTVVPLQDDKDGRIGWVRVTRDITEHIQAQEALLESERRFQRMLSLVPDMISIHSPQMDILYSNWRGFAAVPESKRIVRTKCYKTYRDLDAICPDCRAKSVLVSREPMQEERQLPDGTWVDVRAIPLLDKNGHVEMFMEWVRDITADKRAEEERQAIEEQYYQAQKMESVGRLAGGVAHDFNNMLGVILGHAEMAIEESDPAHPSHRKLVQIQKTAERSADLVRQLLAFARKQIISPIILDLNEMVVGMLKMLRRLIGEDIHLAWMPGANLWKLKMDPSQVDQILVNLCVNARDAIADVGNVIIQTNNAVLDEAYCAGHPGATPGEYVVLAVTDDGCGMEKEVLDNLFEPFFTTKEVGKGTGLGLATVYGIVKQNHGFILVYSEPGQGSAFKIHLPRHRSEEEHIRDDPAPQPQRGGNETILLVEDEPMLLEMGKEMLEGFGYRVLAADSPTEAMALAEKHPGEIHLLMTDVVMPMMNGRDLARTLRAQHRGLKCLFMSGYPADVIASQGVLDEGFRFIQKPFSMRDVAAKVREVLDSG